MEFRKELSEKSKELIKKHSKSNIFNIDTEYYKTEKIYPISPKPNEIGERLIEFTPKYPEVKHYQRYFYNSLSDKQKINSNLLHLRPNNKKNTELEKKRTRNREINGYCFDKKGIFSSKKLYVLDFYGTKDVINNSYKKYIFSSNDNNILNKSIKENRKSLNNKNKSCKNFFAHKQKILKGKNKNNLSCLNIHNTRKNDKDNNKIIKKEINYNLNYNNKNENENIKINDNINNDLTKINSLIMKLSTSQKKDTLNYIKTLIDNNKQNKGRQITNNYALNTSKKIYIKKNPNILNTNYLKKSINKLSPEYEIYNIEIKNINKDEIIDGTKVKNILHKNGLHAYDFDENEANNFMYESNKIKAKIRKRKGDDYFEKRLKKAEKELNNNKINMDKYSIILGKKKRKGTPGNELKHKNEND